ncbi:MAG TPA: hypothetical protein VHI99_18305, partial [Vicinamibacterales bacterium]|nr:hypothetical protein [Vicinamibacterales bacterium]
GVSTITSIDVRRNPFTAAMTLWPGTPALALPSAPIVTVPAFDVTHSLVAVTSRVVPSEKPPNAMYRAEAPGVSNDGPSIRRLSNNADVGSEAGEKVGAVGVFSQEASTALHKPITAAARAEEDRDIGRSPDASA